MSGPYDQILATWEARMDNAGLLRDDAESRSAMLTSWLELLHKAHDGEDWALDEWRALVSFQARQMGGAGQPGSVVVGQLLALEETLRAHDRLPVAETVRDTLRLVVDAHSIGQGQRRESAHQRFLSNAAPVFQLEPNIVVGVLIGPSSADLVDALFGRVLRTATGVEAGVAVVDCLAGEPEPSLLHPTVSGFFEHAPKRDLVLVLTGLRSIEATRSGLEQTGVDLRRVRFFETLSGALKSIQADLAS